MKSLRPNMHNQTIAAGRSEREFMVALGRARSAGAMGFRTTASGAIRCGQGVGLAAAPGAARQMASTDLTSV